MEIDLREGNPRLHDLARLRAVNEACERFEENWRRRRPSRIEDVLADAEEADRPCLLAELVALEVELRRERGERPDLIEYRRRFPGFDGAATVSRPDDCEVDAIHSGRVKPPADLAEPADFDKYEILGVLGRGGMGIVYKAWQKDLKRLVAIKMIHAVHIDSPELARRFEEEARCAGGLQHPSIVRVHEAGQYQGRPYFAMEYLSGSGLDRGLERRPG